MRVQREGGGTIRGAMRLKKETESGWEGDLVGGKGEKGVKGVESAEEEKKNVRSEKREAVER
jgi:hypothetical protein